ncbi:unnamed protein product [Parnassius apollo]|uniref:(apollo) hypothetical protein n=1 Tax=Parnassius apollo TaxID=110799 RepID=A0A8S3WCK4_PARAO|nr:unnamed protein product [Parnassius apollo]CAG5016682.1 unnamed protein product [Parnassius apollo]
MNTTKANSSPVTAIKKVIATRNASDKSNTKMSSTKKIEPKQRTNTVTKVSTPKSKENKPIILAGGVTKSAKKALWKRRPKPAHSGVPVPEKMKRLLEEQLKDSD